MFCFDEKVVPKHEKGNTIVFVIIVFFIFYFVKIACIPLTSPVTILSIYVGPLDFQ